MQPDTYMGILLSPPLSLRMAFVDAKKAVKASPDQPSGFADSAASFHAEAKAWVTTGAEHSGAPAGPFDGACADNPVSCLCPNEMSKSAPIKLVNGAATTAPVLMDTIYGRQPRLDSHMTTDADASDQLLCLAVSQYIRLLSIDTSLADLPRDVTTGVLASAKEDACGRNESSISTDTPDTILDTSHRGPGIPKSALLRSMKM